MSVNKLSRLIQSEKQIYKLKLNELDNLNTRNEEYSTCSKVYVPYQRSENITELLSKPE